MGIPTSRLTILATAALAVTVAATSVEAQSPRAAQAQFDNGYREGLREGQTDARRNERFNYTDERAWQRAGNNRPFREGFERGYADGFRRGGSVGRGGYGGYGNGRPGARIYTNPAMAAGFDDGYEQGMDDARDGDRYDPVRAKDYRDGDNDYDRRYGTKDQWKIAYREGFKAGYERGYREARQYGNWR
jgi:hypothetical protein